MTNDTSGNSMLGGFSRIPHPKYGKSEAAQLSTGQPDPKTVDGIRQELLNGVTEERKNEIRTDKSKYKKITFNGNIAMDKALNRYLTQMKLQDDDFPKKSEWIRNLVERELRALGVDWE